jgi:SAM-dependent methyltransferase
MQLNDAIQLIEGGVGHQKGKRTWADLGCGNGLFSYALAVLIPKGSEIIAVDLDLHPRIEWAGPGVKIIFQRDDFNRAGFNLPTADGILMANSLHFAEHKEPLLKRLFQLMKDPSRIVIVEYEMIQPNPWVPYPVAFHQLKSLLEVSGFQHVEKVGEKASVFGPQRMYACYAKKGSDRYQ